VSDLRTLVGELFVDEYEIGEELGGGGMSRLFLAWDIVLKRGDAARATSLLRRALGEGFRPSVNGYHLAPEFAKFRGQGPFAPLIRLIE